MARWGGNFEQDLGMLVKQITGFREQEENYQLSLQFAVSNIRYHRFLDVDGHKVTRSYEGIIEKFRIHSEREKAEKFKRFGEKFLEAAVFENRNEGKTDTHYAILSLLLNLADAPLHSEYKEEIQQPRAEEKDDFDWGAYLLEGEERWVPPDDSEDETEDEDTLEEEQTADARLSVVSPDNNDITMYPVPPPEVSTCSTQVVPLSQEVGSNWLQKNVVIQYWWGETDEDRAEGKYRASNLLADWEKYEEQTNQFYSHRRKTKLTEELLLREVLWLLSGVSDLYVFKFNGASFTLREEVALTHLTGDSLHSFLTEFAKYGSYIQVLLRFVDRIVNQSCHGNTGGTEGVCQTYRAFGNTVSQFLQKWKQELVCIEKKLIKQESTFTLSSLHQDLKPWFTKISAIHSVYVRGVRAGHKYHCHSQKASQLLTALYEAVMEYDTMGQCSSDLLTLLLPMWLQSSQPYISIVDQWITSGNLVDPMEEFIIKRNEAVKSLDETFWESAFILHTSVNPEPEEARKGDNRGDVKGSDQGGTKGYGTVAWAPKFLQPVLLQVILTGKSMEMLANLGQLGCVLESTDTVLNPDSLYDKFISSLQELLGTSLPSKSEEFREGERTSKSTPIFTPEIEEQLRVKGVYDPLLRINFESLLSAWSNKSQNSRAEDEKSTRLLTLLKTENLQPVELILQQCLYPHIRSQYTRVCTKLIHLLKSEYRLMEYLAAVRNFFLMEAGNVMFDFYTQIFDKIRLHEPWRDIYTVNLVLQECLSSQFPDHANRLYIDVDVPKTRDGNPISATNCLRMTYKVPWPVDVVINSRCQTIYNEIFSFILQIKRAKYLLDMLRFCDLERERVSQRDLSSSSAEEKVPRHGKIHHMQILRMRLIHFVNSIHNHIMTRILHSTSLEFAADMEKAVDLDQIIAVHDTYVGRIHERCLLHKEVAFLKEAVVKLLNIALVFHSKWEQGIDEVSWKTIEDLEVEFSRCIKFLASFLNNVIKRKSFPHLESLAFALATSTESFQGGSFT